MRSWAIFLSGRGSTAQALMDLTENIQIRLVVSNSRKAMGLVRARKMGIPTLVIKKNSSWTELSQELRRRRINSIFLLGFMKIVPAEFVEEWQGKIFNIHPSLLPKYPGLEAIEKSFAAKDEMGVTVHHVVPEMDAGEKVLQHKICSAHFEHSWEEIKIKVAACEQRLIRQMGIRPFCRGIL